MALSDVKVFICLWFFLVILGGWRSWQNHVSIERARSGLLKDQSALSHLNQLKREMESNPIEPVDAASLAGLELEYKELLSLRGEYTRLSQTKDWTLQEMKHSVRTNLLQTVKLRRETESLLEMEETRKHSILIRRMFGSFESVLMYLMKTNLGASDLLEVYQQISGQPSSEERRVLLNAMRVYLDRDSPVNLAHCEIVERHIPIGEGHRFVYFRERTHRGLPDGTVGRFYFGVIGVGQGQPEIGTRLFSASRETLLEQEDEFIQSLSDPIVKFAEQHLVEQRE